MHYYVIVILLVVAVIALGCMCKMSEGFTQKKSTKFPARKYTHRQPRPASTGASYTPLSGSSRTGRRHGGTQYINNDSGRYNDWYWYDYIYPGSWYTYLFPSVYDPEFSDPYETGYTDPYETFSADDYML